VRIPYPAGYNLNGVTPANILPPLNLVCQVVNYIPLICWDDWFVVVGIRHYSFPTVKPLVTPSGVVGMVTSPPGTDSDFTLAVAVWARTILSCWMSLSDH